MRIKYLLKQNVLVLIAIALPLLFIFLTALYVSISSKTISSNYSFLYIECSAQIDNYNCTNYLYQKYKVINNKLTNRQLSPDMMKKFVGRIPNIPSPDMFYIYDTKKDQREEITFKEATNLKLSISRTSPDKVILIENYTNRYVFSPFGSSRSKKDYLKKNGFSKQITLSQSSNKYYNNYKFVGWILN